MSGMTDTENPPTKMGRPTIFSPAIDAEILERLAEGESLISICSDERMPSRTAVLNRLRHDAAFGAAEDQARAIAVKALDDEANDLTKRAVEAPGSREQLTAVRIRLDYIQRRAESHKPRRVEMSGPDGGAIRLQAVLPPSPPLPPREVREYVQNLLKTAEQAAGLPFGDDRPEADRITAVLKSGRLPHPDLVDAFANVDPSDAESP
jgi:hypothetical protein